MIASPVAEKRITRRVIRHELKLRLLEVTRVVRLTPRMLRITFGGDELAGFTSAAHDDHVKLFFPAAGRDEPVLPRFGPQGIVFPEDAPRPIARNYTPRRYDAEANTLDIDFVLHGDGPAARWAARARPGQRLGVGGPRGSFVIAHSLDWYLLAGDEAALPAIGRRLEELPESARAIVVAEVENETEEQRFATDADARIVWLHRNGSEAGGSNLLQDAVARLALPDGEGYAWVAAETAIARGLRQHLVAERGLAKDHVRAAAYWKRGAAAVHETYD
jgi:NADPH-dependent ferric siderophore reductase